MTDDIQLAFGHPSDRAAATSTNDVPSDRISLRDHVIETEIGAFQSERGVRQRLSFNVVVELAKGDPRADDDVDRILSYDKVTEAIAAALGEGRLNLLETLAERVAQLMLQQKQAARVFVRIEKLDRGPGALGVEIVRSRAELPLEPEGDRAAAHPAARIVHLSNAAIASDRLSSLIDHLVEDAVPVVLCVDAPADHPPRSSDARAQRRIDLLAIEQNCWVLAGRDRRCVVVSSRTELDWGLNNGQISVWAPSKILLDATGSADVAQEGPHALALWLARQLGATELVMVDDNPASGTRMHRRVISVSLPASRAMDRDHGADRE